MVTFKNITDVTTLFDLLDSCAGAVYFEEAGGAKVDVRHNQLVREMLAKACQTHGIAEFSVSVENPADMQTIIRYLMYREMPKAG